MEDTRVQILKFIEKNCKVDPKEQTKLLSFVRSKLWSRKELSAVIIQ